MNDLNIRFAFGDNWQRFVDGIDERSVFAAVDSLTASFGHNQLSGKKFVDVGCGSGIFSLAAVLMGAKVISFDSDADSVVAAKRVRKRFLELIADKGFLESNWHIFQSSILDSETLKKIEGCDIYYCWGVAHHTGNMLRANENLVSLLDHHAILYLALYNDQDHVSVIWREIKRRYCTRKTRLGRWFWLMQGLVMLLVVDRIYRTLKNIRQNTKSVTNLHRKASMNFYIDFIDWVGGYPYEVISIDAFVNWAANRGCEVDVIVDVGNRLGCNEYLIRRIN